MAKTADTKDLINQLEGLIKLDIDAVEAYTSAIERIDIPDVKQQLALFRNDHERHVTDLSPFVERLGGKAPSRTPDLKGFFLKGFTAIQSMMGNEAALNAMKGNEELTNKTYAKALEYEFPSEMRDVVQRNYDDERRHLAYINKCITERIWERAGKEAA